MTWALFITTFALGLRHGVDLDHLAAIGDITSSDTRVRSGLWLSFLYALGHAAVVFALGMIAVSFGGLLPASMDEVMGKIVGLTLIAMGIYVLLSLIRNRGAVRLQSRWMIAFGAARRTAAWFRRRRVPEVIEIVHEHQHAHDSVHDHAHGPDGIGSPLRPTVAVETKTHTHLHTHVLPLPDDPLPVYDRRAALGVGAIHGVGAETPTQVMLFLSAAGIGGAAAATALLVTFLAGLFVSNMAVAGLASWSFQRAEGAFPLYVILGTATGAFSFLLGASLLLD